LGLQSVKPPEYLYHGTGEKYRESIDNIGLIPKSRQYVHLSDDFATAVNVGARHGDPVVYRVHARQMTDFGFIFLKSENGVWLTDRVPVWAIERIM
jgi:putative RNA 2'-phosphotransferase